MTPECQGNPQLPCPPPPSHHPTHPHLISMLIMYIINYHVDYSEPIPHTPVLTPAPTIYIYADYVHNQSPCRLFRAYPCTPSLTPAPTIYIYADYVHNQSLCRLFRAYPCTPSLTPAPTIYIYADYVHNQLPCRLFRAYPCTPSLTPAPTIYIYADYVHNQLPCRLFPDLDLLSFTLSSRRDHVILYSIWSRDHTKGERGEGHTYFTGKRVQEFNSSGSFIDKCTNIQLIHSCYF